MNKLFFVCIFVSALFFGCSYNEENDYQQTVINNSSYDVEVNGTLISSKTSATFELSMSADDDDEFLKITSTDTDYPRVTMTRDAISFHRYEYTISDYADSFKYYDTTANAEQKYVYKCKQVTIVNAGSKAIKVFNPYFYSTYSKEKCWITVEAGKTVNSTEPVSTTSTEKDSNTTITTITYSQPSTESFNLYNDYTTFTAVYDDDDDNVSASVDVEPIRYTVSSDVTEASKRKGNGYIIGYKVIVK